MRLALVGAFHEAVGRATHQQAKVGWYRWALLEAALGRSHLEAGREARRHELLDYQTTAERIGIPAAVSILSTGACAACAALDGRRFSVEEALRLMPLPCTGCTTALRTGARNFCRCGYLFDFNAAR